MSGESGFIPGANDGDAIYPPGPPVVARGPVLQGNLIRSAAPMSATGNHLLVEDSGIPFPPGTPVNVPTLDVGTAPYATTGDLRGGTDYVQTAPGSTGDLDLVAVDSATDTVQFGETGCAEVILTAGNATVDCDDATGVTVSDGASSLNVNATAGLTVTAAKGVGPFFGLLATVPGIALTAIAGTTTALLANPGATTLVTHIWLRTTTAATGPVITPPFVRVGTNGGHDNWVTTTDLSQGLPDLVTTAGAATELGTYSAVSNGQAVCPVSVGAAQTLSFEIQQQGVVTAGACIVTAYVFGFRA